MSELKEAMFFEDSNGMQKRYKTDVLRRADSTEHEIESTVGNLSNVASLLLGIREDRTDNFGNGDYQIDDVSFHIMLDLMVSDNEGKLVTSHDLATNHRVRISTMFRYVEYLAGVGLIDKKSGADDQEHPVLKLTNSGVEICNRALLKIDQRMVRL